jgi:hypothetical protein
LTVRNARRRPGAGRRVASGRRRDGGRKAAASRSGLDRATDDRCSRRRDDDEIRGTSSAKAKAAFGWSPAYRERLDSRARGGDPPRRYEAGRASSGGDACNSTMRGGRARARTATKPAPGARGLGARIWLKHWCLEDGARGTRTPDLLGAIHQGWRAMSRQKVTITRHFARRLLCGWLLVDAGG